MINQISLRFDDVKIGQKAEFTEKIKESMINEFAKISGDFNPLHIDEEYAKKTKFRKRICQGMLLGSLVSRLLSTHLPGNNALYVSQTLSFILPCFINDEIMISGEIVDKDDIKKVLSVKTTITRDGEILVTGIAKVMLKD